MLTESLAMDAVQVEFRGQPSHAAAAPWDGRNALDALLLLFTSINALRQQMRPDARVHGIITAGGTAPNVIPEYTAAKFYIRAKKRSYVNELVEKFKACVQAAALATSTTFEISNYENSFDDMANNLLLAQRMTGYMTGALGSTPFLRAPDSFGSIDMGNVSHVVPGIHILVDIANGHHLSPHTREFCSAAASDYAGQTVLRAGKALALTGCDLLCDDTFRAEVAAEFQRSLA